MFRGRDHASHGRICIDPSKLDTANHSTQLVSGLTYEEYFQQYDARVNGSTTEWGNPVYDGVWSLALALNNSIPNLSDIGVDLAAYTYGYKEATDIVRDEVVRLKFQGASGHISYSNITGYALVSVDLNQVLDNTSVIIIIIIMLYSAEMQEMREMGGIRITRCTEDTSQCICPTGQGWGQGSTSRKSVTNLK